VGDGGRERKKFFHKRIGCTCLTEKYKLMRTLTKLGRCYHCHEAYEWNKLMPSHEFNIAVLNASKKTGHVTEICVIGSVLISFDVGVIFLEMFTRIAFL